MNKILIISPFTEPGEPIENGGGGMSYNTRITAEGLLKNSADTEVIIIAEKQERVSKFKANEYSIERIWKYNSLFFWVSILKRVLKESKDTSLLIQFEFGSFGSFIQSIQIIWLLFFLKFTRKKAVVVVHQVIFDLNELKNHLGIRNPILIRILNFGLKLFYSLITLLSSSVVVFEQILKNRFSEIPVNRKKIHVIPHGINVPEVTIDTTSKAELRKKYNLSEDDFVLVQFGYLTWYKGSDLLVDIVDSLSETNKTIKLIVGGGPSATLKEKEHYQKYYSEIEKVAHNNPNITITGFVPDKDIKALYELADLVLLPYRKLMASSGPLSWAIAYKRPFLLSNNLIDYLKTKDMRRSFGKHLTHPDQLVFNANQDSLKQKINLYLNNKEYHEQLNNFVENLHSKRGWDTLAQSYYRLLFPSKD